MESDNYAQRSEYSADEEDYDEAANDEAANDEGGMDHNLGNVADAIENIFNTLGAVRFLHGFGAINSKLLWKRHLCHLQGFAGTNAYIALNVLIYRWHFLRGGIFCRKTG
jgi:hypothetical protein